MILEENHDTPAADIFNQQENNPANERAIDNTERWNAVDFLARLTREYATASMAGATDGDPLGQLESLRGDCSNDASYVQRLRQINQILIREDRNPFDALQEFLCGIDQESARIAVDHAIPYRIFEILNKIRCLPFAELGEMAKTVHSQSDIQEKLRLADACEERLHTLLQERQLYLLDRNFEPEERLTPETLTSVYSRTEIYEKTEETFRDATGVLDAILAIRGARREAETLQKIGHIDRDRLETNTALYGAKGAHLLALQEIAPVIDDVLAKGGFTLPPFELLPVSIYQRWKNGEDITGDLRPLYDLTAGGAMHIRSSARYSEDNATMTGAGIYETVTLGAGACFEEFMNAVDQVYRSTESEKARHYRTENGVTTQEEMGVIVQKTVNNGKEADFKGYINTARPGVPDLMDIAYEEESSRGTSFQLRREDVRKRTIQVGGIDDLSHVSHVQMDMTRMGYNVFNVTEVLAEIGTILELYYGCPLQIEFIEHRNTVYALQARTLPAHILHTSAITFPEQEHFYESAAIGAGDVQLDVLPATKSNSTKEGLVIFTRSYYGSMLNIENHLPGKGAVIVLSPSRENGGHIETLCAERGLVCLFADAKTGRSRMQEEEPEEWILDMFNKHRDELSIPSFSSFNGHTRVRVVADGLIGRIYPVVQNI